MRHVPVTTRAGLVTTKNATHREGVLWDAWTDLIPGGRGGGHGVTHTDLEGRNELGDMIDLVDKGLGNIALESPRGHP